MTSGSAPTAVPNRIDIQRPDAPELAAYGEHAVGVRTLRVVDRNRPDIVNAVACRKIPRYDRPLILEIWYPAILPADADPRGSYLLTTRDGTTQAELTGRALRDSETDRSRAPYPLVILSHGYPGNRFLLSHFGENLASKGYVVASIDHTDSTYADQGAFASTLYNRPLDQLFVVDELARRTAKDDGFLAGLIDVEATGIIGYSMGGYGVVNALGGGFTHEAVLADLAPPDRLLAVRETGNAEYLASRDPRIRAAIAIAPWGMNVGFWDASGLAGVETPIMFMAGSVDDVSGYENGVRAIFEGVVNVDRYLLTFENANHNAAAPIPAPKEAWEAGTFDHYADPVWDSVRMNNIAQHFATAFFAVHLKRDSSKQPYLDLVAHARSGVWSLAEDGTPTDAHTHWLGFQRRTAAGLILEHLPAGTEVA